jgi:hypothetical protein
MRIDICKRRHEIPSEGAKAVFDSVRRTGLQADRRTTLRAMVSQEAQMFRLFRASGAYCRSRWVAVDLGLKTPGMSEVIRNERLWNSSKLAGSCRLMTSFVLTKFSF